MLLIAYWQVASLFILRGGGDKTPPRQKLNLSEPARNKVKIRFHVIMASTARLNEQEMNCWWQHILELLVRQHLACFPLQPPELVMSPLVHTVG